MSSACVRRIQRPLRGSAGNASGDSKVPAEDDIVIDFHVCYSGKLDPDAMQRDVQSMVNQINFTRPIRRIVVSVAAVRRGERVSHMQHFTYRLSPVGIRGREALPRASSHDGQTAKSVATEQFSN